MNFIEWRKLASPSLRRTGPTAIIHSGGTQTIFGCLCGATHTCATDYDGRNSKHVREWRELHDETCDPVPHFLAVEKFREEIYSNDTH